MGVLRAILGLQARSPMNCASARYAYNRAFGITRQSGCRVASTTATCVGIADAQRERTERPRVRHVALDRHLSRVHVRYRLPLPAA